MLTNEEKKIAVSEKQGPTLIRQGASLFFQGASLFFQGASLFFQVRSVVIKKRLGQSESCLRHFLSVGGNCRRLECYLLNFNNAVYLDFLFWRLFRQGDGQHTV